MYRTWDICVICAYIIYSEKRAKSPQIGNRRNCSERAKSTHFKLSLYVQFVFILRISLTNCFIFACQLPNHSVVFCLLMFAAFSMTRFSIMQVWILCTQRCAWMSYIRSNMGMLYPEANHGNMISSMTLYKIMIKQS